MGNFTIKKKRTLSHPIAIIISIVAIIAASVALRYEDHSTVVSEKKALNQAVERCIVSCYAENGFYPPSLQYLEENYNIIYDHDVLFIDYRPIATNIYPYFSIIAKGDYDEGE